MQSLLLQFSIRAILIAAGTGAILAILRVKAPRVRHAAWTSVLLLMLGLPLSTAWAPKASVVAPAIFSTAPTVAAVVPHQPAAGPRITWQTGLAGVYLIGFFALIVRLAVGTVRAHALLRRTVIRGGRLTANSCAPVTVGWLRPSVILPEHWQQWPEAQLQAVLAHETEHARWRDPLVQWLAMLNRAIFWFHPLAWWLEHRLSALAEEACDAAVLAGGHDPLKYSEYLLQIARSLAQQSGARQKLVGMAMPGPFLSQRIHRILESAPAPRITRLRLAIVATACAAISTIFTAGAVEFAQAQADAAALSGAVTDPSGARVPGCLVIVHNAALENVQTTTSSPAGLYQIISLPAGRYTVEFQMRGFAKLNTPVLVEAGHPVRLNARLQIGQATSSVTVERKRSAAAAPAPIPSPDAGRIEIGGRVEMARLIRQPQAVYPPELLQQGIEGTVQLDAIISGDGVPVELRVVKSEPPADPRFVQAALDAVRQWRYQPAKLNEHPVATVTKIDVNFRLDM